MDLKAMHQKHQYDEICSCWEQHKMGDAGQSWKEWDYVFAMNALYKSKRYPDCLDLYREFHKSYPQSDLINDRMGWAVYQVCLKDHDFEHGDNQRYLAQVEYLLKHCEQGKYSPLVMVVEQAVKSILKGEMGARIDYPRARHYLDALDPKKLSSEERSIQPREGRVLKLASEQERWYTMSCKVYFQLKQYEACISCCDQALSVIRHFHNHGDFWLRRLKIESLQQLGRVADAKAVFQQLLIRDFHPWTLYELGYRIAAVEEDTASALRYIGAGALTNSNHEMRVRFYEDSADFLYQHGFERMAMLQLHFADCIRKERKWKVRAHSYRWQIDPDIRTLGKQDALKELKPFWKERRDKDKVFQEGRIKRLLASGRCGFITGETGENYFFAKADVKSGISRIKEGVPVRFTLVKRLDSRKNRISDTAVEITIHS